MSNTVSLCMIVKDEMAKLPRLIDGSLPLFEQIVVVDTGSTDGTLEWLQEKAKTNHNLLVKQFAWIDDFAQARNFGLQFATQSWTSWLDSDDLPLDPEKYLRFKAQMDDPAVDYWTLDYIYARNPDGSPQLVLGRERFVRRSRNPRWVGAIHEVIDVLAMRGRHYEDLKVIHDRSGKQIDLGRNVRILAKEYEKNPSDARTAYYYGKELFDRMDPKGIEVLEKYIALPGGQYWDDMVGACFRVAKHFVHTGNYTRALNYAEKIYHLDGTRNRAEGYWIFGEVEKALKNYEVAIKWYERCLVPPPPSPRVMQLEYFTWHPHKKIAECYWELGRYDLALEHAEKVVSLLPQDQGMRNWRNELNSLELKPKAGTLVVIEAGSKAYRPDSWLTGRDFTVNVANLPFAESSLDGFVVTDGCPSAEELIELGRVIKPGGFLWVKTSGLGSVLDFAEKLGPLVETFSFLVRANYRGTEMHCLIRVNPILPKFSFSYGDLDFGPHRIRIENLRLSAAKQGAAIVPPENSDVFVGRHLRERSKAKVTVLDICEKLDGYQNFGVEHADAIYCSSDLLAIHLKKMYPEKPVFAVDDHFEMHPDEWL